MALYDIKNESELTEVLREADVLVLDFWAPWCPPCKAFKAVFEEVAQRHPEAAFCRVNTEEEDGLSPAFEVTQIPTLVVIRDRIMVASQQGYLTGEQLDDLLRQVGALDMGALMEEIEGSDPMEAGGE